MESSAWQQQAALREALTRLAKLEANVRKTVGGDQTLVRHSRGVTDRAASQPTPDPRLARWAEKELAALRESRKRLLDFTPPRVVRVAVTDSRIVSTGDLTNTSAH